MVFKPSCVLLLYCIASCSGGSSNRPKEDQYCGEDKFYCLTTDKCLDRSLRCTGANVCIDQAQGKEAKCFKHSAGRYNYYRKKASIFSSGSSSRKRSIEDIKHWFVEYRGFVYEFGSYGVQELDVNDPKYKYGPRREKVTDQEWMGTSSCTRNDVLRFRDEWLKDNPKWDALDHNCQAFVKSLEERLHSNCLTKKRRSLEGLKANCTVSSSTMVGLNWKLFTSLPALILFIIFRMY